MSYILSMIEFREFIREHNESNEDYHLVLDENFSKEVHNKFRKFPGVLMMPYAIEGKMTGVYYVSDLSLEPFISKEIEIVGEEENIEQIDRDTLLDLFKDKLMNAQRMLYSRGFISDLNYLLEKHFIEDHTFVKAFTSRGYAYNRMTKIVNKYPVSCLYIDEETGKLMVTDYSKKLIRHVYTNDYIFEYKPETLVFNVLPGVPVMNIPEIQKLYDTYLSRLENLYIMKYVDDCKPKGFTKELKELLSSIVRLYIITRRFVIKSNLFDIIGCLESGKNFKQLRMNYNHIVLMLLENKSYLKGLHLDRNLLKFVKKDLGTYNVVSKVESAEVDLGTLAELRGFVYRLNQDRKDIITVVDAELCKNRFAIASSRGDVLPYVVYLKEENKLVMVYECLSEGVALELRKPIIGNRVRLQWNDIQKIAIRSFKNIDKCLFRPLVYKTYKYLHLARKLKDDDLLTSGGSNAVRCMKDLYMIVPMNDIVWKNEHLYLKLPGFYRIRNLKYQIRYDVEKRSYYTLVKYPMKSWEFIDTMIACLEYEYDFNNTPEFNTACNILLTETLEAIRYNKKVNTRVITLRKMYLDCVKAKLRNNLVDMVEQKNGLDKNEVKLLKMMKQVKLK